MYSCFYSAICLVLLLAANFVQAAPLVPVSTKAQLKSALLTIYQDERKTFLCEQAFSDNGKANLKPCPRCPKIEKNIQWMPIVPHQQLASRLSCFNEKICADKQGKTFKGLPCCFERDALYRQASLDLHNFVPELDHIKQQRRHFTFGMLDGQKDSSRCQLILDKKKKMLHTPLPLRGMVARTYLYMREKYYLPLSEAEVALYQTWHREYPASRWEKARNDKIYAIQGNKNPYV